MTLIVKFLHGEETPGNNDHIASTLISDVQSITFPPGEVYARLFVRDQVKTAAVPGFVEHERLIMIAGPVYVMNEAGKTISVFRPSEPISPRVSYKTMSPGDMLQAVGDDAQKWAAAFVEQFPDFDQEAAFGWFANAIENAWDVRCSRLAQDDERWADFQDQVRRHRELQREVRGEDRGQSDECVINAEDVLLRGTPAVVAPRVRHHRDCPAPVGECICGAAQVGKR